MKFPREGVDRKDKSMNRKRRICVDYDTKLKIYDYVVNKRKPILSAVGKFGISLTNLRLIIAQIEGGYYTLSETSKVLGMKRTEVEKFGFEPFYKWSEAPQWFLKSEVDRVKAEISRQTEQDKALEIRPNLGDIEEAESESTSSVIDGQITIEDAVTTATLESIDNSLKRIITLLECIANQYRVGGIDLSMSHDKQG